MHPPGSAAAPAGSSAPQVPACNDGPTRPLVAEPTDGSGPCIPETAKMHPSPQCLANIFIDQGNWPIWKCLKWNILHFPTGPSVSSRHCHATGCPACRVAVPVSQAPTPVPLEKIGLSRVTVTTPSFHPCQKRPLPTAQGACSWDAGYTSQFGHLYSVCSAPARAVLGSGCPHSCQVLGLDARLLGMPHGSRGWAGRSWPRLCLSVPGGFYLAGPPRFGLPSIALCSLPFLTVKQILWGPRRI